MSRKAGARTLRPSDTPESPAWPELPVPWLSGRWQPLHSIYARSCLEAVDNMLAGGGVVRPILRQLGHMAPVLDRAGGSAWGDMWRAVPPLAATAFALETLRIRPPKPDPREA